MADSVIAPKPEEGHPWDVIIIGSGPSSFTAAIYTTRGAASTLIIGGESWGGQLMLTTEVDNYPGLPGIQGPDLMVKMRDHALKFGAEMIQKNAKGIVVDKKPFEVLVDGKSYLSKALILATGADTRWLEVPGEEKFRGRGVSSCAPCDAPFFKNKNVVVVGGGDSAMEEALVLTKYASKVTIIHRRDEFKASQAMQKRVFDKEKQGKISIIWNSEVTELLGDTILREVRIKNSDKTESSMEIDGVFVAIGHIPASDIYKGKIELDEKGYVKKIPDENYRMSTSVPGIFVAGDVHDYHYRQAITAAGFGCQAAMDALKYLDNS
jgi:thioredoxin reductase (NADPH)